MYPGTTAWVNWVINQTGQSGSFTPTNGAGTYKFRARIQQTVATTSENIQVRRFARYQLGE